MKMIFQMPACFWRKADSSHFCFTVPEGSVMLPSLTQSSITRFIGGDGDVFDWPYLTHAGPFNRAE
jgi:hypothetical protein